MNTSLRWAALVLCVSSACGDGNDAKKDGGTEQPMTDAGPQQNTDAGPNDPVDAGPDLQVDEATFREAQNNGTARLITESQQLADQTAYEATRDADKRMVEDYLAAHANEADLVDWVKMVKSEGDDTDPAVLKKGDLYELTLTNALGTVKAVAMGDDFKRSSVAQSIRGMQSRDNQLSLFKASAGLLSENARAQFNIPSDTDADAMSREELIRWVGYIAQRKQEFIDIYAPPFAALSPVRACGGDVGKGALADRYSNNTVATVDSCATPSSSGLVSNFEYPLKKHITCVKDQANRGTCWAFSLSSMMESFESVKYGQWVNYSEQDLVNRNHLFWNPKAYGDGAWPGDVLKGMLDSDYRPQYENSWAYNSSNSRTANNMTQTYTNSCTGYTGDCSDTAHQGARWCLGPICAFVGHLNPNTTRGAKSYSQVFDPENRDKTIALMVLGTIFKVQVALSFAVYPSFRNPVNGFVAYTTTAALGTANGNHVVHVVGYVSNEQLAQKLPNATPGSGGGYFIVKNSWGACDGDAGYKYLPVNWVKDAMLQVEILNGIQ